mgnify:FL=1
MKTLWPALVITILTINVNAITLRSNGVILGDPSTITQDRFEANTPGVVLNPDFEFSTLDFSGVGWDSATPSRSVTLISDRHFVAAKHHAIGSNVSFLTSSGVVSYAVASQVFINNPAEPGFPPGVSDLRIGTLTSPIDLGSAGINFYPVLDPTLSPVGQDIIIYGQNGRIGESTITTELNINVGGVLGRTTRADYVIASGDANDAYFSGGDSGGPSFIVNYSGDLVLSGVHWAVGDNTPRDEDNNPTGPATLRQSYDSQISRYITSAESQVAGLTFATSTPEPSSTLLLLSATFGFALRRKR